MERDERAGAIDQRAIPRAAVIPPKRRRNWTVRAVVAVLLIAFVVGFAAQNGDRAELQILFWSWNLRLGWTILGAVLLGIVLGLAGSRFRP